MPRPTEPLTGLRLVQAVAQTLRKEGIGPEKLAPILEVFTRYGDAEKRHYYQALAEDLTSNGTRWPRAQRVAAKKAKKR